MLCHPNLNLSATTCQCLVQFEKLACYVTARAKLMEAKVLVRLFIDIVYGDYLVVKEKP